MVAKRARVYVCYGLHACLVGTEHVFVGVSDGHAGFMVKYIHV